MILLQFSKGEEIAEIEYDRRHDCAKPESHRATKEDFHEQNLIGSHRDKATYGWEQSDQPYVLPQMWTRDSQRGEMKSMVGENLKENDA